MIAYSFTGHRPNKLGGYGVEVAGRLYQFAMQTIIKHCNVPSPTIISGMALGWDQAVAMAGIKLGLRVVAAIPFTGQESVWPMASQDRYNAILSKCSELHVCSGGNFSSGKMHVRNRWMVDHSVQLIALWDGSPGGTQGCVDYARSRHAPFINVWQEWVQFQKDHHG